MSTQSQTQGSYSGTDDLATSFVQKLDDGLNTHARSSIRKSKQKHQNNFVNDKEVAVVKMDKRISERRASNSAIDKQLSKAQRYKVRKLAQKSKARIIRRRLEHGNSKQSFTTVKSLSVPVTQTLPAGYDNDLGLANAFAEFFDWKI